RPTRRCSHSGSPPPASAWGMSGCPSASSCGLPGGAPGSASTACAATSSARLPRARWPRSTAPTRSARTTCAAPRRWRSRTVVATLRARLAGAEDGHLREHVRAGREGALLCLVVDASGSMGARRQLAHVKGALLGLLRDAYARRDRVAILAFRDGGAHVLVAP